MASGGGGKPTQLRYGRGGSTPTTASAKAASAKAAPEPTGWAATPNFTRERAAAAAAATPYTGMNWNPKKDADVMVAEYRKPRPAPTGLINKYR
jgi:hypothetical protein